MDTCTDNCGRGIAASKVRERHFVWALILNGGLAVGEVITSIMTGSSAILADGLMNVDDVAALLLSIYSERKTRQAPDERQTFGYQRMDVFAGFVKGCLLLVTSLLALVQAVRLIINPEQIAAIPVIIVGGIAIVINLASALGLKEDACHSLNAKGTFSCMAYDAIGSAAVVASAVLSLFVQTVYFDVAAAFLIAFFMAKTGWGIFQEGMGYFLQSAPDDFDYSVFERMVGDVKGVSGVGDIHVWNLTPAERHLTCKVRITVEDICDCERIVHEVERIAREKFTIHHVTIQPVYSEQTLERFCKSMAVR